MGPRAGLEMVSKRQIPCPSRDSNSYYYKNRRRPEAFTAVKIQMEVY
jgi:hypothetical protein